MHESCLCFNDNDDDRSVTQNSDRSLACGKCAQSHGVSSYSDSTQRSGGSRWGLRSSGEGLGSGGCPLSGFPWGEGHQRQLQRTRQEIIHQFSSCVFKLKLRCCAYCSCTFSPLGNTSRLSGVPGGRYKCKAHEFSLTLSSVRRRRITRM